ncbi:MAG: hypothetical protein VX320_05315 [Candidatus Thermoplasmatota archaeon]|nr:hypothetical protein [Candidatus Thermoplasmatota archaeon]
MEGDELTDLYRVEAAKSIEDEANKRIIENADSELDARLRATPLYTLVGNEEMVPAIISRLGIVRAALEGHGGGIKVESAKLNGKLLDFILNLDGACLACGAAPGTLEGIQNDLLATGEVSSVKFSVSLLDTFDEIGREFVLKHSSVEFV